MVIGTDAEIRDLIEYTDERLAEIIGKTRQAVNRGLNVHSQYFKPREWLLIVGDLEVHNNPHLTAVRTYLDEHNVDIDSVRKLDRASPISALALDDLNFDKVEAILPDIESLRAHHPGCFDQLISIMSRADVELALYLSDYGQKSISRQIDDLIDAKLIDRQRAEDIRVYRIKDADHFPDVFSVRTRDARPSRILITCIDDRYVRADQTSYRKIFEIAVANVMHPDVEPETGFTQSVARTDQKHADTIR